MNPKGQAHRCSKEKKKWKKNLKTYVFLLSRYELFKCMEIGLYYTGVI